MPLYGLNRLREISACKSPRRVVLMWWRGDCQLEYDRSSGPRLLAGGSLAFRLTLCSELASGHR